MKIITITLSPTLDITYTLGTPFEISGTYRPISKTVRSGGKGINLSRALVEILCAENVITAALIGTDSQNTKNFTEGCETFTPLIIARSDPSLKVRNCIKIKDSNGTITEINESTEALTNEDVQRILAFVADIAVSDGSSILILCGSAPEIEGMENTSVHIYSLICEIAGYAGITCVADSSGRGLLSAVNSGVSLIKPNLSELCELAGEKLDFHTSALGFAKSLFREKGCEILLTNGGEGAYFIGREGVFRVDVSDIAKDKNAGTVGIGDIMLAAFADSYYVEKKGAQSALRKSSAIAAYMANLYLNDKPEYPEVHAQIVSKEFEKFIDGINVIKIS